MRKTQGPLAVLLAAGVIAAGVFAQRLGTEPPSPPAAGQAVSGAWFCPHGGGGDWSTSLEVANPGPNDVQVRISSFGAGNPPAPQTLTLGSGSVSRVSVPSADRGASSMVEYFGGWVAAGWVTQSGGEESGVAAEPCAPEPGKRFYLPDGTTEKGQQAYVVVMNPFAATAVFTLELHTGEDHPITTTDLSDYVLKAHRSVAFHINQAQLRDTVAVQLTASLGRVAAASLGVADAGGIRSVIGIATPAPRWILPGGLDSNSASVAVFNPSADRAQATASLYTDDSEQTAAGAQNQSVDSGRARTFSVVTSSPSTIDLQAVFQDPSAGQGVVATRRTFGVDGDQGATAGASAAGVSWVVLPAVSDPPYDVRLLLSNPGDVDAKAEVTLLGPEGTGSSTKVTVPAHRTTLVPTGFTTGAPLDAAMVKTSQGVVLPVFVGYSSDHAGYAVSAGVPVPRSPN